MRTVKENAKIPRKTKQQENSFGYFYYPTRMHVLHIKPVLVFLLVGIQHTLYGVGPQDHTQSVSVPIIYPAVER